MTTTTKPMDDGKIVRVPFPFVQEEYSGPKDGEFFDGKSWRPGVRHELVSNTGDTETLADGMGEMVLEVVSTHRPGRYPERTFFLRSFVDPTGRAFGKAKLRVTTTAAFKNLTKGYRHEFEMAAQSARQENSNDR